MVDHADREETRQSQRPWLLRAEQSHVNALLRCLRWRGDANAYPERVIVDVAYSSTYFPADPLHEGQGRALAYQQGVSSPVRELMSAKGLDRAAAEAEVRENLRLSRELGVIGPAAAPAQTAPADGE